jgi:hypothetical protein
MTEQPTAESEVARARLTSACYSFDDWADLHLVVDGDCVEGCPACVANDLLDALRAVLRVIPAASEVTR